MRRAFQRWAVPLAWYYAITLGLPIANGAADAGATFLRHAAVVALVPLLMILLAYAAVHSARALAGTGRSDCVSERERKRIALIDPLLR